MQPSDSSVSSRGLKAAAEGAGVLTHAPLIVASIYLVGLVGALYRVTIERTGGALSYPLDDTFIHMAIGRNVAQHGVFGVTPDAFAAASSSVLWPLVLAAVDLVLGDRLLTPLVVNLALGVVMIAWLARLAVREAPKSAPLWRALVVLAVVAFTPLPTLVLLGMEHTAHALASVVLLVEGTRWLCDEDDARRRPPNSVLALAAVATALRYEATFLVGILAALALLRRRPRGAAALVASCAAPIVLFGVYSLGHGGTFLPTSILLKGNRIQFHDFSDVSDFLGVQFTRRLTGAAHLMAALLATSFAAVVAIRRHGLFSPHASRIVVSALVAVAHVELAGLGWFFRYEAYVVALLVTSVGVYLLAELPSLVGGRKLAVASAAAIVIACLPLARRAARAAIATPNASRDIYEQQMQSARFLARYFPDGTVAVNDVGAVAYARGAGLVDLGGLATLEAARAKDFKMLRPMKAADVARLTERAPIAIVYDEWITRRPASWIRLAQWRIDKCTSCAFPVVSIYATGAEHVPRVMAALTEFTPSLPAGVRASGISLASPASAPPTSPDYTLFEGDVVLVTVPGLERGAFAESVRPDGRVPIPHAPAPIVRGLRVADVPAAVARAVSESRDPDMPKGVGAPSARLIEPRRARFYVAGNVGRTGDVWSSDALTLASLLARCGGPTPDARADGAPIVYRRSGSTYARVELAPDDAVEPLDIVVVP